MAEPPKDKPDFDPSSENLHSDFKNIGSSASHTGNTGPTINVESVKKRVETGGTETPGEVSKEQQDLIRQYNNNRIFIFVFITIAFLSFCWGVYMLAKNLGVATYMPLAADTEIENKVATGPDGKMVVLSVVKDSMRSVLISYDSGAHFDERHYLLPRHAGLTVLAVAPDSTKAVFVCDSANQTYIKYAGKRQFVRINTPSSFHPSGICFQPHKTNAYIFGNGGMLHVNYADTSSSLLTLTDVDFEGMAFNENGNRALAIHNPRRPQKGFYADGIGELGFANDTAIILIDRRIESGAQFDASIVGNRNIWYIIHPNNILKVWHNGLGYYGYSFSYIGNFRQSFSTPLNQRAIYGSDNYIDYTNLVNNSFTTDEIPFASSINDLAFADSGLTYAVVKNGHKRFLARKAYGKWEPMPIFIKTAAVGEWRNTSLCFDFS